MRAITLQLQDMPAAQAHFCLGVERFIHHELGLDLSGGVVVCAFSGGVDSTVLLAVLAALAPRLGCSVVAAHLDHNLRSESEAEAEHARKFCQALGVECVTDSVDVAALAGGTGLEETARDARYAFLSRIMADRRPKKAGGSIADNTSDDAGVFLATGHQLDDLAEDMLMRLTRGTGWPQLGGMRAFAPERNLLRPLLLTPRADIEAFARALELPWVEDASNNDPDVGLRNRMRLTVKPLILRENPNFLESVATLWRGAHLDRDYFEGLAAKVRAPQPDPDFLPREALAALHPALRLRLYKTCLEGLGQGQPLAEGLRRLDAAFTSGQGGKTIQFPGNKEARVSGRGVHFMRRRC